MQNGPTSITLPAGPTRPASPTVRGEERFGIQPVFGSTLAEVANFLHRQLGQRGEHPGFSNPEREDCLNIERRLRWFLLGNPLTDDDSHHGFCIRDSSGIMRGLTLCFPGAFLAA